MEQRVKAVVNEALEIPFQFGCVTGLCHFLIIPRDIDDVIMGLDFLRDIGFSLTNGHEKLEVKFHEPNIAPGIRRNRRRKTSLSF